MIIIFTIVWLLAGWYGYTIIRKYNRRHSEWTVEKRSWWLPISLIFGPVGLFSSCALFLEWETKSNDKPASW